MAVARWFRIVKGWGSYSLNDFGRMMGTSVWYTDTIETAGVRIPDRKLERELAAVEARLFSESMRTMVPVTVSMYSFHAQGVVTYSVMAFLCPGPDPTPDNAQPIPSSPVVNLFRLP